MFITPVLTSLASSPSPVVYGLSKPPNAPTSLSVSCTAGAQIDGTFVASTTPGVTAQRVYRRVHETGSYVQVGSDLSAVATSFSDPTGSAGVRYQYVIRAVKNGIESANSDPDSAYTDALYDLFTEGSNTELNSHTPNYAYEAGAYAKKVLSGTGLHVWRVLAASDVADTNGASGLYYYTKNCNVANFEALFDLNVAGSQYKGLACRDGSGADGNFIECHYDHASATKVLAVGIRTNGTASGFVTTNKTLTLGTHAARITGNGDDITFTIDGSSVTKNTSTHNSNTRFGPVEPVRTTVGYIDNLRVRQYEA